MTEKRFYIDTIDGGGSVLTMNGVELGLHETCDLLNELHEENEQLEQKNQLLYEDIDFLKGFIEERGFKVKLESDKR